MATELQASTGRRGHSLAAIQLQLLPCRLSDTPLAGGFVGGGSPALVPGCLPIGPRLEKSSGLRGITSAIRSAAVAGSDSSRMVLACSASLTASSIERATRAWWASRSFPAKSSLRITLSLQLCAVPQTAGNRWIAPGRMRYRQEDTGRTAPGCYHQGGGKTTAADWVRHMSRAKARARRRTELPSFLTGLPAHGSAVVGRTKISSTRKAPGPGRTGLCSEGDADAC